MEKASGLDAGVEATGARRHAPDGLDRVVARLVSQAFARMGPRPAQVRRFPDRGAEPFVAAAAVDRAGGGIGNNVVHRPRLAERSAQRPRPPFGVMEGAIDEFIDELSQRDEAPGVK